MTPCGSGSLFDCHGNQWCQHFSVKPRRMQHFKFLMSKHGPEIGLGGPHAGAATDPPTGLDGGQGPF